MLLCHQVLGENQLRPDSGIADGLEFFVKPPVTVLVEGQIAVRPVTEANVEEPVLHEVPTDLVVPIPQSSSIGLLRAQEQTGVLDSARGENELVGLHDQATSASVDCFNGAHAIRVSVGSQTKRLRSQQDLDVARCLETLAMQVGETEHGAGLDHSGFEYGSVDFERRMIQIWATSIDVVPFELAQARCPLRAMIVRHQFVPTNRPATVCNPLMLAEVVLVKWAAVPVPVVRVSPEVRRLRGIGAERRARTGDDLVNTPTVDLRRRPPSLDQDDLR